MGPDYHIDHLCQKTGKILENILKLLHCPTTCITYHILLTYFTISALWYFCLGPVCTDLSPLTVEDIAKTSNDILIFFISAREYSMPMLH